ncbi:MAG TPA: SLC13 family permease [Bacteroidales bacterium]|nr:SLC13 family permease [Bacteroidales bacterium]
MRIHPFFRKLRFPVTLLLLLFASQAVSAADGSMPTIAGIRIEFIIFALTLIAVALFHHKTMYVALTGLAVVLICKYIFTDFSLTAHIIGNAAHEGEWRILLNLLGLLFGFAILAEIFKESRFPDILPHYLPDDWKGGFVLLVFIFILSSFLDNIAAAMIGGTIALVVFKGKVHIGYLAAVIAAANAGGAGSVVGDTTTTLMWIDGVSPLDVTHAFVASFAALFVFGTVGSIQQDRYNRIVRDVRVNTIKVDWGRIGIVFLILVCAILANYFLDFPALGVWIGILVSATIRKIPWHELKKAWMGTVFLMSLVTIASLMPVDELPPASRWTAFALGFISAVFDNIPLTKLCLEQGGYDWGVLAYAVGFGGSMIWFGSSAGVALSNLFPETRNTVNYIKSGWHVIVAYVVGFFVMLYIVGWHPHEPHKEKHMEQKEVVIEKGEEQ